MLSIVGESLFERAATFKRVAAQYDGQGFVMPSVLVKSSFPPSTVRDPLAGTGVQDLTAATSSSMLLLKNSKLMLLIVCAISKLLKAHRRRKRSKSGGQRVL